MAFISKSRVKQILDGAPPDVDKYKLLDDLVSRGNTIEGLNSPDTQLTTALKSQPDTFMGKVKSALGKGWDALAVPEQMSREGLTKIAEAIPGGEQVGTGPVGTISNAAKAGTEALAQVAPGFVSRGAIATAGALRGAKAAVPLVKAVGEGLASGAESLSGLEYKTPGVLKQAYNDASLIFGKGKQAAGKLYNNVLDKTNVRPIFKQLMSKMELLKQAEDIAKQGGLSPEEALIARRVLDSEKRNIPEYAFRETRTLFDKIAKAASSEADTGYSRAVKSEALRQPFPTNKLGGTSVIKTGLQALSPKAWVMSPLAQGATATGLGIGARQIAPLINNPATYGPALAALMEARKRKLEQQAQDQP